MPSTRGRRDRLLAARLAAPIAIPPTRALTALLAILARIEFPEAPPGVVAGAWLAVAAERRAPAERPASAERPVRAPAERLVPAERVFLTGLLACDERPVPADCVVSDERCVPADRVAPVERLAPVERFAADERVPPDERVVPADRPVVPEREAAADALVFDLAWRFAAGLLSLDCPFAALRFAAVPRLEAPRPVAAVLPSEDLVFAALPFADLLRAREVLFPVLLAVATGPSLIG